MRQVAALVCVVAGLTSASLQAQQPLRHLSGLGLTEHFTYKPTGRTEHTTELRFKARDEGPAITIEFRASYRGQARPGHEPPSVVDVIVVQHDAAENAPAMAMAVNGRPQPLVARAISSQSIAATITFDEFVRLANAESVVQNAFGSELEFSTAQLQMLRHTAERWAGR